MSPQPPEAPWLAALRAACAAHSQRAVARRIGYSATAVNRVLSGRYDSDIAAVQQAVERVLMSQAVECPVQGEIARSVCVTAQTATSRANPLRLQLARTCPTCTHRSPTCAS